jgi:hypothetical protein
VIGVVAGTVVAAGAILIFIYNCPEGCDFIRFFCLALMIAGACLCAAACVLYGITVNDLINGGPAGISSFCYDGYCRLEFIIGACCGVAGLGFIFALCAGISACLTT